MPQRFTAGTVLRIAPAVALAFGASLFSGATARAEMTPQDYLASKTITVKQGSGKWTIRGPRCAVTLDAATLEMSVKTPACDWRLIPPPEDSLTVEIEGKRSALALTDAANIDIAPYETSSSRGVKIDLSGFRAGDSPIDLRVQLFVCLERSTSDLICEVTAQESGAAVKELCWPGAFEPASVDATVIPAMQGMLIPRDWPERAWLYDTVTCSRGLYMPWWGHQKGGSAAMLIIETPEDAGCRMTHPAGGPTLMQLRWLHSLGRLVYPRRARICFIDQGNYVQLAKRYRDHVLESGHFVSLREKIARSPLVRKLIGSPVVHTHILYHIQPDSSYYKKDNPAGNHIMVSFDDRAKELRNLASLGVTRAYVHLDGWGFRGYDNLHPDILPPCPEAGGWDGMKRFADACDELGFVFAIHDQYRDFYLDAASYDERHTIIRQDGSRPFDSTWFGGKQSILCSSLAPGCVTRNFREILARGVKLRGAYLDVFDVVPPDECYNPEHPVTRAQCLANRARCFNIVRALAGVVSSEEPTDWAIPYLDLVHHGPYALNPDPGGGPAIGIPVPLLNLVYHDAIILPWHASGTQKGGWGIPNTDLGMLHTLLNAGIPYVGTNPGKQEIALVREMCALHKRVGLLEMTRHEFLDHARRKQRTTYADGTTVTVDFDAGSYDIQPPLTDRELSSVFP